MNKKRHGGPREGAGRKPLLGKPMARYQVMLDSATARKLRELGKGNLSAGIRAAAELTDER